ncbi:MAG: DUF5656 family protein [Acidobacteriota bacterium]
MLPTSHYALLALFFLAGLELSYAFQNWFVLAAVLLLVVVTVGIILIRIEERGAFQLVQIILPLMAAAGLTLFALYLPTPLLHAYFIVSSFIFYFVLKHAARQAYPTWNWIISLVILFVSIASLLGWRFHFYAPPLFVLALFFAIVFLMAFQSFVRYLRQRSEAALVAACFALVLTEVVWVLQFFPLHYMVQAGILITLYYVMFQLLTQSFADRLERRDIIEYMLVGGVTLSLLLVTAQWL